MCIKKQHLKRVARKAYNIDQKKISSELHCNVPARIHFHNDFFFGCNITPVYAIYYISPWVNLLSREKKFGCATLNLGAVALPSTWIVAMICSNKNVYV